MKKLWLVPFLAAGLYAADLTGKWTGTIEVSDPTNGDKINTPVKAEFDQKANVVSGKIGRVEDRDLETIKEGKVDGKKVMFEVLPEEATSPMKFVLTLVTDNRIEGNMQGAVDVGKISGKVVLTRVK